MTTRKFQQNVLDWEASEGLSFLYGCANMILVVSPLCDVLGCAFLSVLTLFMAIFCVYRLVKGGDWDLFKQAIPKAVAPTVRWSAGLALLAGALKVVRFDVLEPHNLWLEIVETVAYLVVMAYVMVLSVPVAFGSRYRDVVPAADLEKNERRMLKLYIPVVLRIMLHQPEIEDYFRAAFMVFSVFLTSFVWKFGFQGAKFE